jgi:hypothetical protein
MANSLRLPFPERRNPIPDLTQKTIALLRRASDFAAVVHDNQMTEVVVDGVRVSAATLELQLRIHAGKLEFQSRKRTIESPSCVLSPSLTSHLYAMIGGEPREAILCVDIPEDEHVALALNSLPLLLP